jgi:glutathione S-transferase
MVEDFVLYGHRESGNVFKVALMLRLCGAPFAFRVVALLEGEQRTPAFHAINPFGEVPVLIHRGRTLVQTSLILPYLAEHLGRFGGRDAEENRRIAEWIAWETGRLTNGVSLARFARKFLKSDAAVIAHLQARGKAGLDVLERRLGDAFILGPEPTIADISACAYLLLADEAGIGILAWPKVAAWLDRVRALPGFVPQYELLPEADRIVGGPS